MGIGNTYDPSHEDAVATMAPAVLQSERDIAAAAEGLDKALAAGTVKAAEPLPEGTYVFVAPVERNTAYLINPTERKIMYITDPTVAAGRRGMDTEGDVWVKFSDGICMINATGVDGQKQLAWAKSHPAICRDIAEPMTAAWVQMKEAQTQTSRREASLPTGLDVDRLLSGDPGANRSGNVTADRAKQALDSAQAGA